MSAVHVRRVRTHVYAVSQPRVANWLQHAWTGGADDLFPSDVIPSHRTNPAGTEPGALVPNVTMLGHAVFPFRFEGFDGHRWRVTTPFAGWHGFDLEPELGGCRVTHTLDLMLPWPLYLAWVAVVRSGHDWAVDALFDRLDVAIDQGAVPVRTRTRPPWHARLGLWLVLHVAPVRWGDAARDWLSLRIPPVAPNPAPNVRSTPRG